MNEQELLKLIKEVTVRTLTQKELDKIPIAVSNRHVHLSKEHLHKLFGHNYQLKKLKDLSQPGQFACRETVTLIGPSGRINNVRILGPSRGDTQIEISLYDGYTLGVNPPIRHSGDLDGTPSIIIKGPRGKIEIPKGLICAARHIHMHPEDAKRFHVHDKQFVKIKVEGPRGIIFDHVLIRVSERYKLEMHIDIDEANAAYIENGQMGKLLF